MAEKIDELQLGITSDAQSAIDQLGNLSKSLQLAAINAERLGNSTAGINNFVGGLKNLSSVNLNGTIKAMQTLSKSGGKTTVSVGGNLTSQAFKAGLDGASKGIKDVFKASLDLGGKGVSALGSFMGKLGLIPSHASNVDKLGLSFTNLLKAVLPFIGIRGVFDWLKESVGLGSSIVEIENVIDTAFGDLNKGYDDISGRTYKWAKTTKDSFGVSELAALRYAGRLQSIFNSSGFDSSEAMRDSASKMTTDLIERAGDIASFYDISIDEAMTKMQSGLVGMSRPLRSLGINLSVANMESYALSQGITTSWKEMDQASQMALRYSYILNASQYAAGDFQRTQMSLANQLRILSVSFQELSATIGQGLVSAIAPVVGWLNILIGRLVQAANAFKLFMWTLFGKPLSAARGIADDLLGSLDDSADAVSDLGGGASGASDGLGSAGKSAKELKKQLTTLPFDELNQLAKDTDSASSGGSGGGGGGGIGGGGLAGLSLLPDYEDELDNSPLPDAVNRWAARMREAFEKHQWKNLGRIIAEGINAGFEYIYDVLDWNKLKPKIVDGFITPFQDTFNSMMYWIDWDLVGHTFARGLNDVVYTLRAWITGFEWREYGTYLATGMNGMLDEWDADAFGRLIADKFKMAWDLFGGWVSTFDFTEFGTKLKELVTGAIDELDPEDMGKSLGDLFNGISNTIISFLEDGDVESDLADAFAELVNGFLESFDAEDASYALSLLKDTLLGGLTKAIKQIDKKQLKDSFSTVLSELPWTAIAAVIGAKAGASLAIGIFGTAFKLKAASIIAGINVGGGATTTTATTTGASAAAGATGLSLGTIVGATLAIGAITIGGIELGKWIKSKGWGQLDTEGNKRNAAKVTAEGQTKNQQALNNAGINGAGYSTQIQTVPQATKTQNVVTTTLKGITDKSFSNLLANKAELFKDPVAVKTGDGNETSKLKELRENFHGIVSNTATKTADGYRTQEFNNTKSQYHGIFSDWATKNVEGHRTSEFNTTRSLFHGIVSNWATKTADGYRTGDFKTAKSQYDSLNDKWVTAHIDVDVESAVNEVYADINGAVETIFKLRWNAKGGLFTRPVVFQGFGEAGAEAAIPLERKSTMKRIASAIVDSGGMTTGNSAELANEIAMRVAPIIMSAVSAQNERPVNVNATLYTEDNEVLARAVNQGNRSLDKRYNPVAQFSY